VSSRSADAFEDVEIGDRVEAVHPSTGRWEPGVIAAAWPTSGPLFVRFDDPQLRPTYPMDKGLIPYDPGDVRPIREG